MSILEELGLTEREATVILCWVGIERSKLHGYLEEAMR